MDIISTWENGKRWNFETNGFTVDKIKLKCSLSGLSTNTRRLIIETIYHRKTDKRINFGVPSVAKTPIIDQEICRSCKLKYRSNEDVETDIHWVNCGYKEGHNW